MLAVVAGALDHRSVTGEVVPAVGRRIPVVVTALPATVAVLPEALPTVAEALPEVVGRVPTLVAVVPTLVEAVPEVVNAVPDGGIATLALPSTGRTAQPVRVTSLAGPSPIQPAQPGSVHAGTAVSTVIPPPVPVDPPASQDDRVFEIGAAVATSRSGARVAASTAPFGPDGPFGPNSPFRTAPAGHQATPVLVNSGQWVTIPAAVGWPNPPRFPLTCSHGDVIRAGRWPGVPAMPG